MSLLPRTRNLEEIRSAVTAALESTGESVLGQDSAGVRAQLQDLADALFNTQEHLLLAVRSANVGVWHWNVLDNVVTVSPLSTSTLGYDTSMPESFEVWIDRIHPDDRESVLKTVEAALSGALGTFESEHRVRHADGTIRWVLTRGVCHHDANGRVVKLAGGHIDITRLKRAEQEASDRARLAALSADVAVALTEGGNLREMLARCAGAITHHLDASLARIWVMGQTQPPTLTLQASRGILTQVDGPDSRLPVGQCHIGRVAETGQPFVTNAVNDDPDLAGHEWAGRVGLVGGAVYPLLVHGRAVGVLLVLTPTPISLLMQESFTAVASTIAVGIERTRLEESRQQLADLLDATPDFVTIAPIEGPPVYVNPAARRALGIGVAEQIETLLEFRPPGFGRFLREVVFPAAASDGVWSGETDYVTRSGDVRRVSQVSVAHTTGGRLDYVSSISRDIGNQNQGTAALRKGEERTRFALEAARAGVWDMDLQTGVVTWSDSMRAVQGFATEEFGGTLESFLACVHPDDRPALAEIMVAALGRQGDFRLKFRTLWPDGTTHWVESHGRVLVEATGRPIRVLAMAQDVTEREQLEAQLQQAQKIEAIGQLAGGLAHDFNNLLTVILGHSHLLEDDLAETDPRRPDILEIRHAGERAAQLTRQLLAFSRKQILHPVVLDLNGLIANVNRMLSRLVGEHIDLVLRLQPDTPTILADHGQIEQVLVNLAVNARDAMTGGGTLTVETTTMHCDGPQARRRYGLDPGLYVVLTVTDTGIGMDEQTKLRIFEPFFTTKERGKGTGLGLATVFGIVKQSGGSIEVDSTPGNGASFRIYFPATRADVPLSEDRSETSAPTRGSECVLLVEDENAVRHLARSVLERRGYTVIAAACPEEALRLAAADAHFDVLLTDVVMPGSSGPDLFRRLRTSRPTLRVLFMSGFADEAIAGHGIVSSNWPFLQKPFTGAQLARKVRNVMDEPPPSALPNDVAPGPTAE